MAARSILRWAALLAACAPLARGGDALQRSVGTRERYDHTFKVVVAGDSGVGKSSLILRYADNTFNPSYTATIGVDFKIRTLDLDGKRVKLQIWDTAGQDRFRSIVSNYYRGAHGVILVYDVSSAESFDHVPEWLDEGRGHAPSDAVIALFGNKCDVPSDKRQVSLEMAQELAQQHRMDHFETSAKAALNVDLAFQQTARRMKANARPPGSEAPQPATFSMEQSRAGASVRTKCCGGLF
mmetsp:Transcript_3081/g.8119  ORF Transcript_3081/g.8119 Transcript_3081/m.8119 type:complete len:239 (+) Transcript_3081:29-745(+)